MTDRHPAPIDNPDDPTEDDGTALTPEELLLASHGQKDAVQKWREEQFLLMGCSMALALSLAKLRTVDLREFQQLRNRGATAMEAGRILLPVDVVAGV